MTLEAPVDFSTCCANKARGDKLRALTRVKRRLQNFPLSFPLKKLAGRPKRQGKIVRHGPFPTHIQRHQ